MVHIFTQLLQVLHEAPYFGLAVFLFPQIPLWKPWTQLPLLETRPRVPAFLQITGSRGNLKGTSIRA